jgi:hypothetical protein
VLSIYSPTDSLRGLNSKVEGLGEYTTRHLDEEGTLIFPMALQLFAAEDLNTLGRLFQEAKDTLLGAVPPALPATMSAKRPKTAKKLKAAATSEPLSQPATAIGLGILVCPR